MLNSQYKINRILYIYISIRSIDINNKNGIRSDVVAEKMLALIKYRSERKWYATISIIGIFGGLLALMLVFIAMGKDMTPEWKEILLIMLGAFVGSFSRVIDFWFNNSEQDNTLIESAND